MAQTQYKATVIADSITRGVRLTTMEVTFPRFILAEFNTHRVFSRNSASSRAIPVGRRIEQVRTDPFVPESFGKNQAGMQATSELTGDDATKAREVWKRVADECLRGAEELAELGAHKQHANRLIELFSWHTVVVTSTEWSNFFALRDHADAQPEMQITARAMREAHGLLRGSVNASTPVPLADGEWHLPYVDRDLIGSVDEKTLLAQSVVSCAAVSYERQSAERTAEQFRARHQSLLESRHWSPFEHQAQVGDEFDLFNHASFRWDKQTKSWKAEFVGNLRAPWVQYRKQLPGEAEFDAGA